MTHPEQVLGVLAIMIIFAGAAGWAVGRTWPSQRLLDEVYEEGFNVGQDSQEIPPSAADDDSLESVAATREDHRAAVPADSPWPGSHAGRIERGRGGAAGGLAAESWEPEATDLIALHARYTPSSPGPASSRPGPAPGRDASEVSGPGVISDWLLERAEDSDRQIRAYQLGAELWRINLQKTLGVKELAA